MESSTTTEIWVQRVAVWRASGERAEVFSHREGYAAGSLWWWACKLRCAGPIEALYFAREHGVVAPLGASLGGVSCLLRDQQAWRPEPA